MKILSPITFFTLLFFALNSNGQMPNPLSFNTAINSTHNGTLNVGANDLHWSAALTSSLGTYTPAVVCANQATCCWANPTSSLVNWITYPHTCSTSQAEHSCLGNIDVFYKLTFNLPSTVCNSVSVSTPGAFCLSLSFLADNCVWAIYVNGVANYTSGVINPYSHTGFLSFGATNVTLCNNWQPGTNTLIVQVKSGAPSFPGWEGFMAAVTSTVTTSINTVSATTQQNNVSCFGLSNGSATITPLSGPGTYSYSWLPNLSSAATATGLGAGTYTYVVSRAGFCPAVSTLTITQPSSITLNVGAFSQTACAGSSLVLFSSAVGGNPPFQYNWSGGPSTPNYTVSQLTGGAYMYNLTVTDQSNCSKSNSIWVTFVTPVASSLTTNNVLCNGSGNGSASITILSGSGPYSYTWLPSGGSGASVSGLAAGTYTYLVSGANQCVFTSTFTISQPPPLSLTATASSFSACAGSSIQLSLNAQGGSPGYSYNWNGGPNTANYNYSQSIPGAYQVIATVTDSNKCVQNTTLQLTFTERPIVTINGKNTICLGESTTITASGATTYTWSNNVSAPVLVITPTATGFYSVTGATGSCQSAALVTITVNNCTGIENNIQPFGFSFSPNPVRDKLHVTVSHSPVRLEVFNSLGQLIMEQYSDTKQAEINFSEMANGIYLIRCSQGNNSLYRRILKE